MKTDWIVKLNFLLLGFGLTSFFIYQINTKGISPNILSILGIHKPATSRMAQNGAGVLGKVTWCETRVTGLLLPNNMKLVQEGSQWVEESAGPNGSTKRRVVDFIAAEKWLAKYCNLSVESADRASSFERIKEATPAMIVKFVNGNVDMLKMTADGDLMWKGQMFRSSDLTTALRELTQLPTARSKE